MRTLVRSFILVIAFSSLILLANNVHAKKIQTRKVQEVNFDETSLKGILRSPDGAYLVQKKGIKFMPLYDLQKSFDQKIKATQEYVR